jgi:hypothetical protein
MYVIILPSFFLSLSFLFLLGVGTAINELKINSFIELGPKQSLTSFVQKIEKQVFTR